MTDEQERAAVVAKGLTKAQKNWVRAASETVGGDWRLPAYVEHNRVSLPTIRAVERAGLVASGNYPPLMILSPLGLAVRQHLGTTLRDLTESGDFYSGTRAAWEQYRAAVNAGDWNEAMRFETGEVEGFHYDP